METVPPRNKRRTRIKVQMSGLNHMLPSVRNDPVPPLFFLTFYPPLSYLFYSFIYSPSFFSVYLSLFSHYTMQPWTDKAGSSQTSSLHYDKSLSHLPSYTTDTSTGRNHTTGKFRTLKEPTKFTSDFESMDPTTTQFTHNFFPSPPPTTTNSISLSDGGDVLSFLNSTSYSDQVYQDDLRPDSMSYISHRHQMDTQHALAEREKWISGLLGATDIVAYLEERLYIDDVYGIPVLGQLIKEAQEEIKQSDHTRIAVDRLSMLRNHLVQGALGDVELAVRNAFDLNENDWSSEFL